MANSKLESLRELMKTRGIDAYIEPTSDPHQSEYVAEHYKGRAFLTGFTGSAGTAVVTMDEAILWTDGRYFIQAEAQLKGTDFVLYKLNTPGYPTYTEWLSQKLEEGSTIGLNGEIVSQGYVETLLDSLDKVNPLIYDGEDLVGMIWEDRPQLPKSKFMCLDIKYTGKSTMDKIDLVRGEIEKAGADGFLLGSLDDIAWLFNIRGKDVRHNPVVIAYAFISNEKAFLFVDKEKIADEVCKKLLDQGIECKGYDEAAEFMSKVDKDSIIVLDKDRISRWLYSSIPEECDIISMPNLTTLPKGIKNKEEIENQKIAYLKDGIALTKFFYWLETNLNNHEITEIDAAEKLLEFRSGMEDFIEPSFDTIAAYGANAAMMHYSATEKEYSILRPEGLFLLDSGGQYLNGTTDITRTVALGPITDEEKRDFTLVLKGHINLISARFLQGTSGHALDVLARYPLWQEGEDYKSGTGHGVGYLLNVHEGPHRIAAVPNAVALEPGMIVTIEPGIYKQGKHGIRTENVVAVREDIETPSGKFLSFEMLSWCYIDTDCIDAYLLNTKELSWLNNYNAEVFNRLNLFLDDEHKEWLKNKTKRI
jgi:Xaa-Pro aminopeptidase